MVEFFALCRGYGLAMAALMGAVHHLRRYATHGQLRQGALALIWAALAALSNLTLINTFALVIGWVAVRGQWRTESASVRAKNMFTVAFIGLLPLGFLAAYALALQCRGLLDVGTLDGFWKVTLLTNVKVFLGTDNAWAAWGVVAVAAGMFLLLAMRLWRLRALMTDAATVPALLFVGNLSITLILGAFFGVNYPEDRAAMYFYPLLVLGLGLLIDTEIKRPIGLILSAPMWVMPLHFIVHINLSHTIFWKDLNLPVRFYDTLVADWADMPGNPTVGGYKMRGFTWVYLNHIRGGRLDPVHSDGYPHVEADYQIGLPEDGKEWADDYVSIDSDPSSGLHLLRRKERLRRQTILTTAPTGTDGDTDREFFEVLNISTDSLPASDLLVNVRLTLTKQGAPFVAHLVAASTDSMGRQTCYEFIGFDHLQATWNGKQDNFSHSMLLHGLPTRRGTLKVYIWNIHRMPYSATDAVVSLQRLDS